MRKLLTLLMLALTVFTVAAKAQSGTTCNADFNITMTGNTVHFTPVIPSDSLSTSHYWSFGDGGYSYGSYPSHTYNVAGTYVVMHYITRYGPNGGAYLCNNTISRTITITNTIQPCTIQPNFNWIRDSVQTNTFYFSNLTVGLQPSDTVLWIFGDGTTSTAVNPTHTYTNPGNYNVCLLIGPLATSGIQLCRGQICKVVTVTAPCNLQPNFTSVRDSIQTNKYYFTNLTAGLQPGDSIRWTFGDGTSSTAVNPVHVYTSPGTYNVCLLIRRLVPAGTPPCVREICKTVVVTAPCNLQANFTAVSDSLQIGGFRFFNTTVNYQPGDSLFWTFGDGTTSTAVNPTHIYSGMIGATYTVCLKVKRNTAAGTAPCVSQVCKTVTVNIPCSLVQANFTWRADSLQINRIIFTNTSTNIQPGDSIRWTFGDGTNGYDRYDINPTHIYSQPGTYTVCFRIWRDGSPTTPPCVKEICKVVVVQGQPCNLQANFIVTRDSLQTNRFYFANTTVNYQAGDSIRWTFGDGTSSYDVNPTHVYTQPGTYTVCLRIKRNGTSATAIPCVSETCRTIVVTIPCNLQANFTWRVDSLQINRIIFANTSGGFQTGDSIRWTFGDGTSSYDVNPTHVYTQPGTYTVCLRIKRNGNTSTAAPCISEICKVIVVQGQPCNLQPNFNVIRDSLQTNRFYFINTTVNYQPSDSLLWTFGDGTSSNAVNPTHVYAQPGTYTVCLLIRRATLPGATPCVREICKTVTVTAPCNLVANFTWRTDSAQINRIIFTNTSSGFQAGDSIRWTFGDGTSSYDVNPTHVYTQPGTYTVCLRIKRNSNTATGTPCVSEICKVIVVQAQPCNLQANFNAIRDSLQINRFFFINTTVNYQSGDSLYWTFGDGTSSSAVNPTHVYAQPGTYTVCLTVRRITAPGAAPCVREICKTVVVTAPCNLQANFTWRTDSTQINRILFTNTSGGFQAGDSIRWTFGDGTSSYDVNPTHLYTQPGTYTVCLRIKRNSNTATGTPCVSEICKVIVVQGQPCNLQANFNVIRDSLQTNRFYFINTTVNYQSGDSLFWTFGDGTSSTAVNPTHVYTQPGTYTVCLKVRRLTTLSTTPCVSEICKTVIVTAPCNITANFSWRPDSVNSRKIYFTNLNTTATGTAVWNFGDGTSATSWNAVHEYAQPGRYLVCLTIQTGPNCIVTKCDSITISGSIPPCTGLANFAAVRSTSNSQAYTFTPQYQNPAYQYTWSFGDGTGSQSMVANHVYAQPGTYTVCLTVFRSNTCVATSCQTITVVSQLNCNNINVSFVYQPDAFLPNKLYFYAISNFPLLQQRWTITKLPATATSPTITLFQNNPVHVFTDTGWYRVCLRTVTMGGCVKETCQTIHITQVAQQCQLNAYPNPTQSSVNVTVPLTQSQTIYAYVYNAQNVLVLQKVQGGVIGNNIVNINVAGLVSGFYTIKIVYGNKTCYARFQKI